MYLIRFLIFLPFSVLNFLSLKLNKVKCSTIKINGLIVIRNKGEVRIGKKVKINSSKLKNIIGGDTRTSIVVHKGATFVIGKEVKISNSAFQCSNSITIGDYVMIGGSCKIWDTDFHSLIPEVRRTTPNEGAKKAPIVIGDNVFIGASSIIVKGVTIGENSIVAAGSVVSKDIPAYEIWGGNPARFIRKIEST